MGVLAAVKALAISRVSAMPNGLVAELIMKIEVVATWVAVESCNCVAEFALLLRGEGGGGEGTGVDDRVGWEASQRVAMLVCSGVSAVEYMFRCAKELSALMLLMPPLLLLLSRACAKIASIAVYAAPLLLSRECEEIVSTTVFAASLLLLS